MLIKSLVLVTDKIYCRRRNGAAIFTTNHEQSAPLFPITVDLPVAALSSQINDLSWGVTFSTKLQPRITHFGDHQSGDSHLAGNLCTRRHLKWYLAYRWLQLKRNGKLLLVSAWEYRSPISTKTEFWKSRQNVTNASTCPWIVLKTNDNSPE